MRPSPLRATVFTPVVRSCPSADPGDGSDEGTAIGAVGIAGTSVGRSGRDVGVVNTSVSVGRAGIEPGSAVGTVVGVAGSAVDGAGNIGLTGTSVDVAAGCGKSLGKAVAVTVGAAIVDVGVGPAGINRFGARTTNVVCQFAPVAPVALNVVSTLHIPACVAVTVTVIERASPGIRSLESYALLTMVTQAAVTID